MKRRKEVPAMPPGYMTALGKLYGKQTIAGPETAPESTQATGVPPMPTRERNNAMTTKPTTTTNTCGAKTTSGEPCTRLPVKGKSRCELHGGASTGPKKQTGNTNAMTHGIYRTPLTDEERADAATVEVGNVDVLIRLAHIQLRRAMLARNNAQNQPELEEVAESENGVSRKSRVIDYDAKIDRALARIGSLEIQRKTLMESSGTGELNINITGGF